MRCIAEMEGSDEKGSPVAVYWMGRVDARRICGCSGGSVWGCAGEVLKAALWSVEEAASVMACAAVVAREEAELVTEVIAASRTEAARVRRAADRLPRTVVSEGAEGCSVFASFGDDAFVSVSAGAALIACTAAEPIPITALPRRLIAEAPVLIKMEEAVAPRCSSGGGGRGSSSCFGTLVACILSAL